jgi:hypothetical protein
MFITVICHLFYSESFKNPSGLLDLVGSNLAEELSSE